MYYDDTISTYKLKTIDGNEIEILKLKLDKGIPFLEGEDILNDWLAYLRQKY